METKHLSRCPPSSVLLLLSCGHSLDRSSIPEPETGIAREEKGSTVVDGWSKNLKFYRTRSTWVMDEWEHGKQEEHGVRRQQQHQQHQQSYRTTRELR